ncbi:MAG: hypothetical protein M0R06_17510 [Sphaerochaeta sp.]|jgi:hypothetical protein|nr:hypothetical protein [Sphaerochaeta sp.]
MEILLDESINLEEVADLCATGMQRDPPKPCNYHRGDIRYHEYVREPLGIMSWGRIWETSVDCYLTHYVANLGGFYQPDVESIKDRIIASLDGIMWLPDLGWMVCGTEFAYYPVDGAKYRGPLARYSYSTRNYLQERGFCPEVMHEQ